MVAYPHPQRPARALSSVLQCRRLSILSLRSSRRLSRSWIALVVALGAGTTAYFFLPDISRSAPTSIKDPLSPRHFTPATVLSNGSCGPDTKLLELVVPPHLLPPRDPSSSAPFTPIWSVFIKDDDIQVERPYTPLEGIDDDGRMLFLIKKYPKGEVGRWLHSKNVGDQVELRGPLITWPWKEDTWDEVVMISGGTGFTPFYQLFHTLISRKTTTPLKTHFTLLHSSRTPDDLPPASLLEPLTTYATKNPDKLTVQCFVDSLSRSTASPLRLSDVQVGRIGKAAIQRSLGLEEPVHPWWQFFFNTPAGKPVPQRVLFLICGPEPMISALSGPYGRNFSQGRISGVLGEMGFTSKQVYKL